MQKNKILTPSSSRLNTLMSPSQLTTSPSFKQNVFTSAQVSQSNNTTFNKSQKYFEQSENTPIRHLNNVNKSITKSTNKSINKSININNNPGQKLSEIANQIKEIYLQVNLVEKEYQLHQKTLQNIGTQNTEVFLRKIDSQAIAFSPIRLSTSPSILSSNRNQSNLSQRVNLTQQKKLSQVCEKHLFICPQTSSSFFSGINDLTMIQTKDGLSSNNVSVEKRRPSETLLKRGRIYNKNHRKNIIDFMEKLGELCISQDSSVWRFYEGSFSKNLFNGIGSLYIDEQFKLNGYFRDGKADGRITIIDKKYNQIALIGQFKDGYVDNIVLNNYQNYQ